MMRELQSGQSIKIDSVTMKTAQDRKYDKIFYYTIIV